MLCLYLLICHHTSQIQILTPRLFQKNILIPKLFQNYILTQKLFKNCILTQKLFQNCILTPKPFQNHILTLYFFKIIFWLQNFIDITFWSHDFPKTHFYLIISQNHRNHFLNKWFLNLISNPSILKKWRNMFFQSLCFKTNTFLHIFYQ